MSKIPAADRERLVDGLSHGFGRAKLKLDGREVKFQCRQTKPLCYQIMPFLDGSFQGGWLMLDRRHIGELDETGKFAQRLLRPRIRKLYGPKKLKELNRMYKRAGLELISKERNEQPYLDLWHCPKALVRHLEREFDTIEILEPTDAAA